MPTAYNLTPEQLAVYRATAQRRRKQAWGIAPKDTFQAIGAILDMNTEVEVNLVDVNTCRPSLLEVIEQDGIDL